MLSPRLSLGIAQTVFYTPAVPLAVLCFVRQWNHRPRMAWWPLVPLTLMHLAGGITTTILEKNNENESRISLIITAIMLLNVGAIPLIVTTVGQVRLILADNLSQTSIASKIAKALRLSLLVVGALLAVGGGVSSSDEELSRTLSIVGYVVFAAVLAVLIAMELCFFMKRSELLPSSQKVLMTALFAAPLLVTRTLYAILEVSNQFAKNNIWSPLHGNLYAFCFMCLLAEYIAICIYFSVGLTMSPDRSIQSAAQEDEGKTDKASVVV